MRILFKAILFLTAGFSYLLILPLYVSAKDSTEPIVDRRKTSNIELRSADGNQSLRLGVLFGQAADISITEKRPASKNSYQVSDARIALLGNLASDFSYMFQADLARDQGQVLDLRVTYSPVEIFQISAGKFKIPFGAEFLVPAAETDFINRSQAVRSLGGTRMPGVELSGSSDFFFYRAGGFVNQQEGQQEKNALGALRAGSAFDFNRDMALSIAAGGLYSEDIESSRPAFASNFSGKRHGLAADIMFTAFSFTLSAEYLFVRYLPDNQARQDTDGFHVSLAYRPIQLVSFLVRYDYLRPGGGKADSDFIIPSIAIDGPNKAPVFFQIEAPIGLTNKADRRLLITLDIAF